MSEREVGGRDKEKIEIKEKQKVKEGERGEREEPVWRKRGETEGGERGGNKQVRGERKGTPDK